MYAIFKEEPMDELVYDKKYHFIDSVSVWLDLDSLIYIAVSLLLIWGIANLVMKIKKKPSLNILKFMARYMILCSLPIFILFGVQLLMSGMYYIVSNVIITFLPLLYGAIIQLICVLVCKHQQRKLNEKGENHEEK